MTDTTDLFVPPAAEGLPPAALDSATEGAGRLDASARTPYGRNLLAHALVQLARDGWLRAEAADGFEPVRDRAAALSEAERTVLAYALDQAQERIWSEDGFTDEDQAAVDSLKRLATGPTVAYRNPYRPGVLLCREHGDGWAGLTPLAAEDLPNGGTCTYGDPADPADVCGRDVLAAQEGGE